MKHKKQVSPPNIIFTIIYSTTNFPSRETTKIRLRLRLEKDVATQDSGPMFPHFHRKISLDSDA